MSRLSRESPAQTPTEKQTLRTDKQSEVVSFDEWLRKLIDIATREAQP